MTVFDELADLRLDVGKYPTSYMVCSKAMARASPAFKGMLYSSFAESKPSSGEWVVHLPDDDPRAFAIILDILHARTDKVPMNLQAFGSPKPAPCPSALLYHLAVIADKYCLVHLLRPWVNSWLKPWRTGGERLDD